MWLLLRYEIVLILVACLTKVLQGHPDPSSTSQSRKGPPVACRPHGPNRPTTISTNMKFPPRQSTGGHEPCLASRGRSHQHLRSQHQMKYMIVGRATRNPYLLPIAMYCFQEIKYIQRRTQLPTCSKRKFHVSLFSQDSPPGLLGRGFRRPFLALSLYHHSLCSHVRFELRCFRIICAQLFF